MTLPSCPNTSNWGAALYHFPECSAVIWQMGQEWKGGSGGHPPPVTAVKGLRSNHLHMTTRPAPHLNSECLMRPRGTPFLVLFSGGRVICMIAARGTVRKRQKADRTGRQNSVSTDDIDQVMCSANDAAWLNTWTPLERSLAIQDPILMYSASALLKALSNSLKHRPICVWRKIHYFSFLAWVGLLAMDFFTTCPFLLYMIDQSSNIITSLSSFIKT